MHQFLYRQKDIRSTSIHTAWMFIQHVEPVWHMYTAHMAYKSMDNSRNCFPGIQNGQGIVFNTLRQRQNERHFADDIFKCIFVNENVWISIIISLKFVPKGPINNTAALVQIMAWRRPDAKPLSEAMMANLPTHICVTRPKWVNNW